MIPGQFPESVMNAVVPACPPPCCCSTSERINERRATAFPLIVISLSQGELSRDQAHTEQFSSPPIQTASVFTEAVQLDGKKKQREGQTDREAHSQSDRWTRRKPVQIQHSPLLASNLITHYCTEHCKKKLLSCYIQHTYRTSGDKTQ